jgi:polysaccharide biosynthesis protein PslG
MRTWRWWRAGSLLMVLTVLMTSLMIAVHPTSAAQERPLAGDDGAGFNVDAIGLDPNSRAIMFQRIGEVQFGWIRQQLRWSAYESAQGQFQNAYVAKVDSLVNDAAARGVRIMFSVVNSPDWAGEGGGLPRDGADFGRLMSFVANRYKGKVQAYEVWNEQNYAYETGGLVDVGSYLPVLKAGYQAIKAVDPGIFVIFGGLTPTGIRDRLDVALDDVEYLNQIYKINDGEVKNYYDVLGAHPGATCNPPDTSWPDDPATNPCGTDADGARGFTTDNSFYFKRILQIRAVMEKYGEGDKPMWLTEFGWDTTPDPTDGNDFARYVTEQQQAEYIMQAFAIARSYDWMGVMFVWNLNFQVTTTGSNDEKWGYGVLRRDWSARPAFEALKTLND